MERIILTENDADEFLESIGVTLYENSMTIGETTISGIEGQNVLEGYGIFLYEDSILVEGEQAEAYKRKKEEEKAEQKEQDKERRERRYGNGSAPGSQKLYKSKNDTEIYTGTDDRDKYKYHSKDDAIRDGEATRVLNRDLSRRRQDVNNLIKDRNDYASRAYKDLKDSHPGHKPNKYINPDKRKEWEKDKSMYDRKANFYQDKIKEREDKADRATTDYLTLDKRAALDAINRHMRRHPEAHKESTSIFSSINFI